MSAHSLFDAPGTARKYKFSATSCSQCGREFGPGDHGFSHCEQHRARPSDPFAPLRELLPIDRDNDDPTIIKDRRKRTVARSASVVIGPRRAADISAALAHAANVHDELVAALRLLSKCRPANWHKPEDDADLASAYEACDAVLAKVGR